MNAAIRDSVTRLQFVQIIAVCNVHTIKQDELCIAQDNNLNLMHFIIMIIIILCLCRTKSSVAGEKWQA